MSAATATSVLRAQPRLLPRGWQAYALFTLLPLWWLLGLSHFIFALLAALMLPALLFRRDGVKVPHGFGVWLAFLAWMLVSAVEIDTTGRMLGFVLRFSVYGSATVLFLYLYNARRGELGATVLTYALAAYWVVIVLGGYLGVLFPHVEFTTPAAHVIPRSLSSNSYVQDMVTARFAEVQTFLGYPIGRPRAFFTYTNGWGSAFALTIPFAFAALGSIESRTRRRFLQLTLLVSLVPAILSVNRGLWLSATVACVYFALRLLVRGETQRFLRLASVVAVAAVVILASPLSTVIGERFAHQHSNSAREALYAETFDRALQSPLVGYGAPRPAESQAYLDSVGTQGQVLYLVFSHGFPALVLFLGWLVHTFVRTAALTRGAGVWAHLVILIALVQAPFYGLETQMFVIMGAAAIALRELDHGAATMRRRRA